MALRNEGSFFYLCKQSKCNNIYLHLVVPAFANGDKVHGILFLLDIQGKAAARYRDLEEEGEEKKTGHYS